MKVGNDRWNTCGLTPFGHEILLGIDSLFDRYIIEEISSPAQIVTVDFDTGFRGIDSRTFYRIYVTDKRVYVPCDIFAMDLEDIVYVKTNHILDELRGVLVQNRLLLSDQCEVISIKVRATGSKENCGTIPCYNFNRNAFSGTIDRILNKKPKAKLFGEE